jgi:hypothetical protein
MAAPLRGYGRRTAQSESDVAHTPAVADGVDVEFDQPELVVRSEVRIDNGTEAFDGYADGGVAGGEVESVGGQPVFSTGECPCGGAVTSHGVGVQRERHATEVVAGCRIERS